MDSSKESNGVPQPFRTRSADPIRVLITGPRLSDPGGVSNYYQSVLPYLRASPEFDITYLEVGKRPGRWGLLHLAGDQARLMHAIHRLRPSIVHVNPSLNAKSFFRDALITWIAKHTRARVIVFFRGWDDAFEARIQKWLSKMFRVTFGRADHFIVLANNVEQKLREWGVETTIQKETTVVADWLVEGFSLDRKLQRIAREDRPRILFMARVEAAKGVFDVLDAVLGLAEHGKPIKLTIAGKGGALDSIVAQLREHPVAAGVVDVVGHVTGEAKRDLLASHQIFCMPTYHGEGMPNAIIEAMAFGMPIITCPAGGIADMFLDGIMGTLLNPHDATAIAKAITNFSDNQERFETVAEFNAAYAQENALASVAAKRLLNSYRRLASSGASDAPAPLNS